MSKNDMSYTIFYRGKPLSYFYGNGNRSRREMIGFSWKSYAIFDSREEAQHHFNFMFEWLRERRHRLTDGLYDKVFDVLNHCIIDTVSEPD